MRRDRWCALWFLGLTLVFAQPVFSGVVETETFSSETLRQRYLDLTEELRCPKCQNQNLADSNSEIAIDLRAEVRRMLEEGKSDTEIINFLVARYGDFVRYRPPVKSTTWLLWGGPGLLVLLGLMAAVIVRRQNRGKAEPAGLSPEEQQKLDQLLQDSASDSKHRAGE